MNNRNKTLDIFKGVLIILVVIRHVLQYSVSDEGGIITNYIWAIQMPGFMIVSGYFANKPIHDIKTGLNRIIKAAEHYALPFFTWFLLINVLLLGYCGRNIVFGLNSLLTNVDIGLWFLWVLFILSIVATCCNIHASRKASQVIKCVSVCITCIVCFGVLLLIGAVCGMDLIGIKYILYYSLFYGFGWFVRATETIWKTRFDKRIINTILFIALLVFLAIVYNYDLYRCDDNVESIALRCIAGFTGNAVLFGVCEHFEKGLEKIKLHKLGTYTLEIYCTHVYVSNLFQSSNQHILFSTEGFCNFVASLICTIFFTTVIIVVIKSIPAANWLMYGKRTAKKL